MKNLVIEKTSSEEGKYMEYSIHILLRANKSEYEDVSNDGYNQKIDVDLNVYSKKGKYKIEVKNDTRICDTGNVVDEIGTQIKPIFVDTLNSILDSKGEWALEELLELVLKFGYEGCNVKCDADSLLYGSTKEDGNNPKHYKLNWDTPSRNRNKWRSPILVIDNEKFKNYVKRKKIRRSDIKLAYHKEDNAYNLIILFNRDELLNNDIARELRQDAIDFFKSEKIFNEYHTSDELKLYLENFVDKH